MDATPTLSNTFEIAVNFALSEKSGDAGLPADPVARVEVYRTRYWEPSGCPYLPAALACCHMDWAASHGVTEAIKGLQDALRLEQTGVWSDWVEIEAAKHPEGVLVRLCLDRRVLWYNNLIRATPHLMVFHDDWMGHVRRLRQYIRWQFPFLSAELGR